MDALWELQEVINNISFILLSFLVEISNLFSSLILQWLLLLLMMRNDHYLEVFIESISTLNFVQSYFIQIIKLLS
jgi:hypothetical protein